MQSQQVGPYRIVEELRAGGGGTVYEALDTRDGRTVALKFAHDSQPVAALALRREVATLLSLNEAGIRGVIQVLGAGVDELRPWFAMELLRGPDLRGFAEELRLRSRGPGTASIGLAGTLPVAELGGSSGASSRASVRSAWGSQSSEDLDADATALRLVRSVAQTLDEVHARGLLHGDLTPSNVLLRDEGEPVLLDFGTSVAAFERSAFREPGRVRFERYGTPGFAAPEVLTGGSVDLRCDIYGLGCILYELLYRRPVFPASRIEDVVQQHLRAAPHFPSDVPVPAGLVELLERMLAKSPERRLRDLHEVVECLSQALGDTTPRPRRPSRSILLRPRFVSSNEPLLALSEAFETTLGGNTATLLLTAPSGAGKTRLLNEFGTKASGRAAVIGCQAAATTSSEETQPTNPGLSLLEPVLEYAELLFHRLQQNPDVSTELTAWREIAEVLGIGAERCERRKAAASLAADRARALWFDALERLLRLLAARHPLVLLCDDLQWADELSLSFLLERGNGALGAVLVVGSARSDTNAERLSPLRAWASREITVSPLGQRETGELVKDLLGVEALPEGLLDYVSGRAEGNPFFIGEYLRAALNLDLLRRAPSGQWTFPTPSELRDRQLDVPNNVSSLLEARFGTISPDSHRVLSQAAILGREFDERALGGSLGDSLAVTRALEALVAKQLLVPVAAGRYRFAHDRIRETAEDALPPEVRRGAHREAALALEASAEAHETSTLARLGHHWAGAAEPARAVDYLVLAAERARSEADIDFACELYRSAIAQARKRSSGESDGSVIQLEEDLADALLVRARHVEAREWYQRAFSSALQPLQRARLKRKEAATHWTLHEYAQAERVLCDAERELGPSSRDATAEYWQEHIQIQLGRFEYLYFSQRSGAEIDRLVETLESPVRTHGTPRQRHVYYVASSSHHLLRNRYAYSERALELARAAAAAAAALTLDQQALGRLAYGFALFFGTYSQCQEALPHMSFAVKAAREARATTLLARATTYSTLTLLRLRDTAAVEDALQDMSSAAEAANLPPYIGAAAAVRGWLGWRRGSASAVDDLERARKTWLAHKHPFPFRWVAGFPLLALATVRDDFESALGVLKDFVTPGQQALPPALVAAVEVATSACMSGDFRDMARACSSVTRIAEDLHYC